MPYFSSPDARRGISPPSRAFRPVRGDHRVPGEITNDDVKSIALTGAASRLARSVRFCSWAIVILQLPVRAVSSGEIAPRGLLEWRVKLLGAAPRAWPRTRPAAGRNTRRSLQSLAGVAPAAPSSRWCGRRRCPAGAASDRRLAAAVG